MGRRGAQWQFPIRRVGATALLLAWTHCACTHTASFPVSSAPTAENTVVRFLKNAERQAETDAQRKEIQRALNDMLVKPPAELKRRRYANYAGQPQAWSITQLLRHYFTPNPAVSLDDSRFFQDVRTPEARAAIQYQLDEVSRALR